MRWKNDLQVPRGWPMDRSEAKHPGSSNEFIFTKMQDENDLNQYFITYTVNRSSALLSKTLTQGIWSVCLFGPHLRLTLAVPMEPKWMV